MSPEKKWIRFFICLLFDETAFVSEHLVVSLTLTDAYTSLLMVYGFQKKSVMQSQLAEQTNSWFLHYSNRNEKNSLQINGQTTTKNCECVFLICDVFKYMQTPTIQSQIEY